MPKAKKPYLEFGRNLARLRRGVDLTQEAAAEKIDITIQYYQRLEQGEHMASYVTLLKIKKAFKATSWDQILPM